MTAFEAATPRRQVAESRSEGSRSQGAPAYPRSFRSLESMRGHRGAHAHAGARRQSPGPAVPVVKGVDLPLDLGLHVPSGRRPSEPCGTTRSGGGNTPPGAKRGIGPSGAPAVSVRCSPMPTRPLKSLQRRAPQRRPGRAIGHGARGRERGLSRRLEDTAAHALRKAEIVGAERRRGLANLSASVQDRAGVTLTALEQGQTRSLCTPQLKDYPWRAPIYSRTQRRHPRLQRGANIGPLCARLVPVLERITPVLGDRLRRRRQRATTPWRASAAYNAADPRIGAVVVQPQFRQGDRDRGRARPCARRAPWSSWTPTCSIRPEMIETFVEQWREGYAMVYGQRTRPRATRRGSSAASRACSTGCSTRFGETPLPEGAGDFRLIDRKARRGRCARWASGPASPRASMPGSASRRSACPSRSRSARHGATQVELPASCSASPSTASRRSRPCL